jgi:hypothetical protein
MFSLLRERLNNVVNLLCRLADIIAVAGGQNITAEETFAVQNGQDGLATLLDALQLHHLTPPTSEADDEV